ncbi:hypothetical protein [Thermodesulfovibrio sp. 3462-1]|uniref:GHKL domain-containing protein n=1 Tax=Thermodesulfovibrio obliviosus TaxID=3118332 RepID=A0AAU8H1D6_9BACT
MKFQIKIIIVFSLALALILFYLNTVILNFLDSFKEDYVLQSLTEKNFIEQKFQEYVKNVLLWEFLLVLSLMLILYKIIEKMLKQEREYMDFLELILLNISHKFGNFLATHKGNIEILKIKYDKKAIQRLETSYNYIHNDFCKILETINRFKSFSSNKEKVNLKEIVEKNLSIFEINKKLLINLKDVFIYTNRQMLDNIVFSLIENAIKYSSETIHIRLTKNFLAIRNDISEKEKGSGVGLKITEALVKKQEFKLKYRAKENKFIVVLKFT